MRRLLPLLILAAGCSSSSDTTVFPTPSGGTVVLDHSVRSRALTTETTSLRVTGLSKNGREVIFPARMFPREDRTEISGVPRHTKLLQVEYLAGGTVVGRGRHYLHLAERDRETITDPAYEPQPESPLPDDEEGQFGAGASSLPTLSGNPLAAFAATVHPLALSPQMTSTSRYFGPNPTLPNNVTLPSLPPVGMQGTPGHLGYPGTCLAWAFGYGVGSYVANQNPDFSLKSSTFSNSTLASPMYLYEVALNILPLKDTQSTLANGTVVNCSKSSDIYLPFMVGSGAATLASVPYVASCNALLAGNQTVGNVPTDSSLGLGSYGGWPQNVGNTTNVPARGVDIVRQFVANGQPVAFVTPVWNNLTALPLTNGVYYGSGCSQGGHAMLIVGYDDTRQAFLVQNSFGTDWPDAGAFPTPSPCPSVVPSPSQDQTNPAGAGRFYLAYSAYLSTVEGGNTAWPVNTTVPTTGNLTGGAAIDSAYTCNSTLVFHHWFPQPVALTSVNVTDPQGNTASNPGGYPLRNGYTYLVRGDGQGFLTGTYQVTITTRNQGTYTGNVVVGNLTSNPYPAQSPAAFPAQLLGTTGTNIVVTSRQQSPKVGNN